MACAQGSSSPGSESEQSLENEQIEFLMTPFKNLECPPFSLLGDAVYISYSSGQECRQNKKVKTIIELKCAKTVGMPMLHR